MHRKVEIPGKNLIALNIISGGHIGFFDGLRGGMSLWVYVYHAAVFVGFNTKLIPGAALAVDIFMLISGFLMTYTLNKNRNILSKQFIISFYLRRIFRIVPVYYLMLLISIIFYSEFAQFFREATVAFPPLWVSDLGNDPSIRSITLTNIVLHLTFLFGFDPRYASNMPILDWSLALEMQFYAVVPFLVMAMRKYGLTLPVVGLAILNFLALRYIGLYLTPKIGGLWPQPSVLFFKIDCFVIGMLLAFYFIDQHINKVEISCLLLILICLEGNFIFAAVTAMCFGLLANLRAGGDFFTRMVNFSRTALQSKPMRFFGDISYDLYLLHPLVLLYLNHILLSYAWYIGDAAAIRFGILLGLSAVVVVPASYLVHLGVERPCQKAAQPIYTWIAARNSPGQPKAGKA